MRFSIVIAAYNEGDALWKTVRSCVETCAGQDYEIIIADDASWDGSVEEVERRFPRVRVLRNPERLGPSPTKDRGARAASGEVLIFLDGHAKPERGAIQRLVEDVQHLRGRAVVTPTIVSLDAARWRNAAVSKGHGYRVELETFRSAWLPLSDLRAVQEGPRTFYESPAVIGCAFAVTRELYETLWGFDPDMRAWGVEDVDFGLKCWLMGFPILHDPEPVVGHRFQRAFDNYSVPQEQLIANQLRLARKNFTHTTWQAWVEQCRRRHGESLPDHPEGLWTHAWQIFDSRRASAEEERAYLMFRRVRDEFWYAERFGLSWPRLRTAPSDLMSETAPARFAAMAASPSPSPSPPPPPPEPDPEPPCEDDEECCECGCSEEPVRYFNGEVQIASTDLSIGGYGKTWQQTDIDGEIDFYQKTSYDNLDQTIKTERYDTTASGNLVARSETLFDDRGRVYRTIRWGVDPATGTVGNSLADNTWYDAAGNVIQRQPAGLMNAIELEYDSLSRLVKQTDPLGAETVFAYDAASNRVSLTDAEDNTTTWGYDGVGRVVRETNPLGDARTFAYDDAGMVSVRTDRLGRVIEFGYDDAGRPTEERWKLGSTTVNTIHIAYDPDGRVATIGDDHSSYAYQYDLNGGMTEVDNDGTPGVPHVILSAQYNRLVEQTSLAASVAGTNDFLNHRQYDPLGRTSRFDQQSNGGNSVAQKRVDFAYEVRGGYSTTDRYADLAGSGLVAKTAYGYDDFARLTGIDHVKGTTSLASHNYTFNAARLINQHATVDGDSDYSYDDDAQLTEALHSFQADESYSYDLTGNRTNTGYNAGDGNRLLSDGTYNYDYDAEGNRTQRTMIATGETVEYELDHYNRLTKVTFKNSSGVKTKEVEYVYDVNDRRIGKLLDSNGDGTVDDQWRFVYDPTTKGNLADVVLVFDGSGNLRHRYLHGPDVDQVLASEDASGHVLWPLADHLGTVRDLAEYDSGTDTTSVVNHLKYDAFGRITGQSNAALTPLFAFTGRDWDGDAALFYYRARWYDANVGRFLTEDPIGFDAGDDNLYRYVTNSPVMMVDPDGMAAPVVVIGGALVGIVVACAFPYHLYSLNHHGGRSDKFRHCWVSCAVSRTCSGYVAEFAGLGKEVRDRMIAAYCAAFPDHAICKGGHGDFWDSLADIAANQQCLAWEQFVFGAVGGWIGALCRESCEDCCSREIGN